MSNRSQNEPLDLATLSWTLVGWRPFAWRLGRTMETNWGLKPDIGPLPAVVPGSIQTILKNAGIVEDWHIGLNSRNCEWVEHRHWELSATFAPAQLPKGERFFLVAEGLDYSGWIIVNGREAGAFVGPLTPQTLEITSLLKPGETNQISIVFDTPPEEQGQIGYTSASRFFKPRYNYSWDWCPRFVPIGVAGTLTIESERQRAVSVEKTRTVLETDLTTGSVELTVNFDPAALTPATDPPVLTVQLRDEQRTIAHDTLKLNAGKNTLRLNRLAVQPWWPNGCGDQKLYTLEMEVTAGHEQPIWHETTEVGFKRVEWQPCREAPPGALPWICVVNGRPVFLQGVNWTPIRLAYQDVTAAEYAQLVGMYREMGCNLLRVWGGAFLESEEFYRQCDEHGLLVWQEFPLSSSGIENWPPEAPLVITQLKEIATSYVRRRRHHVSLLLWSGGNELQGSLDGAKTGVGRPVDDTHPCLKALRQVVEAEDPERRFLPTSPTGPRFVAAREDFNKGLHHEVHGPWGFAGFKGLEDWAAYWSGDDSLFRSEVGMVSASDLGVLRKYAGREEVWPPTNSWWMHSSAWWGQWNRLGPILQKLPADEALRKYVQQTQHEQAEALRIAAMSCKGRFPRCGGFLVWMGHDCFPCPANTSIIDFERNPKPAYFALQEVFRSKP